MEIDKLKELFKNFEPQVIFNQDLKKKNWFNIGGKAKIFYKAENLKDLVKFLKTLNNLENIFVIGAGSNTLITDEIYDGVVIKLGKNFNRLSVLGEDIIISGTAVLDKNLAQYYSLPAKKTDSQQKVVYAQGKVMQYLPPQDILKVSGHAKLDREGNTFTGDNIIYHTKSELVNVPNTGGRATMVIDNGTLGE